MSDRPAHRADRLRRAWQLVKAGHVERLGGTQFRVAGNVEEFYYIDLSAELPCTCRDIEHRSTEIKGMCKHILACRLASAKDDALMEIVGEWIEQEMDQQAATARTTTRKTHSTEG